MHAPERRLRKKGSRPGRLGETLRRAFAEFLTIPSMVIAGFLVLAAGTYALDHAGSDWLEPLRAWLRERIFRDAKGTSDLLATVAGSLITVTSITFSLLLLTVQQSASTLTNQVYDQFLLRRINQIYFGFFVGLSLYTLVILATVAPDYNPVFGATFAFLLTIVALYLIILLLYTTIDQMRPAVIIDAIRGHIRLARERQLVLLRKTRRAPESSDAAIFPILAEKHGFVTRIEVEALAAAAQEASGELVLRVSVGSAVCFQDILAELRSQTARDVEPIAETVRKAIHLEEQRELETDPAYGIEQLALIAWTSISTAKSNPSPALLAIHSLRELLARWSAEADDDHAEEVRSPTLPVVYEDTVFPELLDAFESMAVSASESMQHQTITAIIDVFAVMFERLPASQQSRAEDLILRILSSLGDHVLTARLNAALSGLGSALHAAGRSGLAAKVAAAQEELSASVGKLGSRATRVRE